MVQLNNNYENVPTIADFSRGDVRDLSDIPEADQFSASLKCSCVRLVPYRFEITEPVSSHPLYTLSPLPWKCV